MEIFIIGGIVVVFLGILYAYRGNGEPNLNSGEWYIGEVNSTNEKEGDRS